jgi:type IV pilus assembly protein PilQ
VKNLDRHLLASILGVSATTVLLAQAPVWAAATKITAVRLSPVDGGMNVLLETASGDRPEVFSLNRGNAYIADIVNAQLQIAEGSFRQNKPTAGIASVEVTQIDANSVRVTITGENGAPRGRIIQGGQGGIILSAATGGPPADPPVAMPQNNQQVAQTPYDNPAPSNEVLLPETDPNFYPSSPNQPAQNPANFNNPPAFQSRAVAPPLGDIAVSNISPINGVINLGSNERIPRLVLRDAPVRDVLALLARAAGLNIAYSNLEKGDVTGEVKQAEEPDNRTISLDIENESVQDVFNYVLRMTGLNANRVGNTIFVGSYLPTQARNVIVRTLRLNQVNAESAAAYLSSMGAETQRPGETISIQTVGTGDRQRDIEIRQPAIIPLAAVEGSAPLLLSGLLISLDSRLNTITLVGEPSLVETGVSLVTQIDLRQRQVAVNVKVIDINLAAQENFNSSFSFGVNDTFIINDGGAATVNFGALQPPSSDTFNASSPLGRPFVENPLPRDDVFFNNNRRFTIPGIGFPGIDGGNANFLQPRAPISSDPLRPGISEYTPAEIELDDQGRLDIAASTAAEATFSLFPYILYPRQFLAQLQAQITNRTGKILTDPTLVVQEGETASVQLVEEIVKEVTTTFVDTPGGSRQITTPTFQDVGLTLAVQVERIDDNGFVTMQVNPEISAPADQIPTGDGGFATQIVRRKVTSGRIRLRDSQTLILSGIISERERTTARKVPLLGDLPIVGSLFRSTDKENTRAEVIVLVTPQILDDSDRSNWGYKYNPSPEAIDMMRRGQPTQRR